MAVNRFVLNGISYHGHGAINEIPGIVKSRGFQKAFVASDPDLVRFGVTAKVTESWKEKEKQIICDLKLGYNFLDMTPKAEAIKRD